MIHVEARSFGAQQLPTHSPVWDCSGSTPNNCVSCYKAQVLKHSAASCLGTTSGLQSYCMSGVFFQRHHGPPSNKQIILLIVSMQLEYKLIKGKTFGLFHLLLYVQFICMLGMRDAQFIINWMNKKKYNNDVFPQFSSNKKRS